MRNFPIFWKTFVDEKVEGTNLVSGGVCECAGGGGRVGGGVRDEG